MLAPRSKESKHLTSEMEAQEFVQITFNLDVIA
jgi:hypothetical protein